MPKIKANGVELYYELHGPADAEVLVLSNGVLMSTASWAFQTPVFSRRYRLLLYDCRGQWQSEHPKSRYSMQAHADDLAALLEALAIPRAHIAGVSYGGEISLIFAYRYPELTQSLVISSVVSQVDSILRGIVENWIAAARSKDVELFYSATYPFNFSQEWIATNEQALAQARSRYKLLDFDAVVRLCEAFLQLNITSELYRIEAPTCLMVGEADILKPRRYADLIASKISQAEYVIIPRAGHAVMWEQAATFNSIVLGFLAQHPTN